MKGQADFETCKKSGNWKVKDQGEVTPFDSAESAVIDYYDTSLH